MNPSFGVDMFRRGSYNEYIEKETGYNFTKTVRNTA